MHCNCKDKIRFIAIGKKDWQDGILLLKRPSIVPFEEAHMLPPLGRSSSTCKKNIKAWARGMMKEEGDVLHKLCTQRKCNFAKITIFAQECFHSQMGPCTTQPPPFTSANPWPLGRYVFLNAWNLVTIDLKPMMNDKFGPCIIDEWRLKRNNMILHNQMLRNKVGAE